MRTFGASSCLQVRTGQYLSICLAFTAGHFLTYLYDSRLSLAEVDGLRTSQSKVPSLLLYMDRPLQSAPAERIITYWFLPHPTEFPHRIRVKHVTSRPDNLLVSETGVEEFYLPPPLSATYSESMARRNSTRLSSQPTRSQIGSHSSSARDNRGGNFEAVAESDQEVNACSALCSLLALIGYE